MSLSRRRRSPPMPPPLLRPRRVAFIFSTKTTLPPKSLLPCHADASRATALAAAAASASSLELRR
ncbi:hypothetical protein Syun_012793 [Stephania yunnanensis]|uniref:Uncharacterized protein n=1 Tax=Stephania yunnanensis TaxID=152371 RepID=A0AAP0PFP2_9MAGN